MRFALTLIATLALAPSAFGQEECEPWRKLVAAAPDVFRPFRGEQQAPNTFVSTIQPHGFVVCHIALAPYHMHLCQHYVGPSEERGRTAYEATASTIRACFPGWTEGQLFDLPSGREIVEGFRLVSQANGGEISVGAALTLDKSRAPSVYRVAAVIMMRFPASVS